MVKLCIFISSIDYEPFSWAMMVDSGQGLCACDLLYQLRCWENPLANYAWLTIQLVNKKDFHHDLFCQNYWSMTASV